MEIFISPARRRMVENNPLYFPFGGKQSRNILRDFKGSMSKQIRVTRHQSTQVFAFVSQ
jgi:hypothetical protein